jgi:hypothetical protein
MITRPKFPYFLLILRNWPLAVELALYKLEYNVDQLLFFQGLTLHVSASKIKFLEVAEELELKKCDKNGLIREFNVSQLDDFLEDGMHVDDLLTTAERQHIVRHELENIRAQKEDDQVPGYPAFRLYEGQSIGKM